MKRITETNTSQNDQPGRLLGDGPNGTAQTTRRAHVFVEDNKAIVGGWFTEFWGERFNPDVIDELAAPDIRFSYSAVFARSLWPLRGLARKREPTVKPLAEASPQEDSASKQRGRWWCCD
jgi:hypothetical protein